MPASEQTDRSHDHRGTSALIPGGTQTAGAIERVAFGALGDASVNAADQATLANGVNVSLDAEVAAAVKALIADFKSELLVAAGAQRRA